MRPWPAMEIARGADGAPVPHGAWGLTLSHAGGVAIAQAFDATRERCGVDVETVEWRRPSFEEEAFTAEERAAFPTGPAREGAVTASWAAKEAVLKALGTGLSLPLHSLVVKPRNGHVEVELAGPAKEKFGALDPEGLTVETLRDGTLVYAFAQIRLARRA